MPGTASTMPGAYPPRGTAVARAPPPWPLAAQKLPTTAIGAARRWAWRRIDRPRAEVRNLETSISEPAPKSAFGATHGQLVDRFSCQI
jgi:hypothetical protein